MVTLLPGWGSGTLDSSRKCVIAREVRALTHQLAPRTVLPIDDTAGLAHAAHDAAERGQVIYLTDPHNRRTYRLADVDAEISES